MQRLSFDKRFINETNDDLIHGKIHTIRQNYDFWKRFEGQEAALFAWEGKPYRSKQKVFCVKRIVSVQEVEYRKTPNANGITLPLFFPESVVKNVAGDIITFSMDELAYNDGFIGGYALEEFLKWFADYKPGKMAILHFTWFRY